MEPTPVSRRTRRQAALLEKELMEENKRRSCAGRTNLRQRLRGSSSYGGEDESDDEIQVVDESVFLKRLATRNSVSAEQSKSVEEKQDNDGGYDDDLLEHNVVNTEEGNDIRNVDMLKIDMNGDIGNDGLLNNDMNDDILNDDINVDESDSSVLFIGEKWSFDDCHSSGLGSDSDGETTSFLRRGKNEAGSSRETGQELSDFRSCLSGEVIEEEVSEESDIHGISTDVEVEGDGGDSDVSRSESENGVSSKRKRKEVPGVEFRRKFDGLFVDANPENNSSSGVGGRTRSHVKPVLRRRNLRYGTFSRPIDIDESTSSSSQDLDDHGRQGNNLCPNYVETKTVKRKRGRPSRHTYADVESESESEPESEDDANPDNVENSETDSEPEIDLDPVNVEGPANGGTRKRGRPRKNRIEESEPEEDTEPLNAKNSANCGPRKRGRPPKTGNEEVEVKHHRKKRAKRLKTNEVEEILLNTILENENVVFKTPASSQAYVPLKFRFGTPKSQPKKSKEDKEIVDLFNELEFALRACEIGGTISSPDEEDDNGVLPCDSAISQEKMCKEGKHFLIQDDEIGIKCKFCSFVNLEIKYVTPDFHKNIFGVIENKDNYWQPYNGNVAYDGSSLPEYSNNFQPGQSDNIKGSVWDLVPGTKKSLYPHQQEAFEFIWRNVRGGIKLDEVGDELGKPTKSRLGGCIICHAPGTGKTRLAITFIQSFIKKYPMAKPVIITPRSMLLTWEEEFVRWNVDVTFLNLNKNELSGKEDLTLFKHAENVKSLRRIRLAKLYTWSKGKGILGVTYRLFEKLVGDKALDEKIKQTLIKQPGILVLDEGHIPRNDESNIWNVLTKVKTKSRIILSGTPFQNNFEELHNTLSLVREEFGNPLLLGHMNMDEDRRILALRNRMKPFVHVHKGEILKKTLRGLHHSVLLLKPSELQKNCCQQLKGLKHIMEFNHLVSVVCVHPSLLCACKQVPDTVDQALLEEHKADLDVGLKIRFLFELINLAVGEKILVFNQFLGPLKFIADLLESHYHWAEGKEFLYMHGQQEPRRRQASISLFNDPKSEARVLLASTKACCEGIHLVGASRVVLLDVVWNPSVERQAISRAYRLGQTKDVFVYHLIMSGTMEEQKYYKQMNKDRLSELVFSSEGKSSRQNISTLRKVSEDRILEAMVQNEKTSNMFAEIIHEPKAEELIESFSPVNA